ncbi:MAG: hypothetical protein MUF54_17550 [Polyangiaceae bacterium]|nr:hypothetical protein [Polyangiaceae bacterium]
MRRISSVHGMYEVRERHVRAFGAGAWAEAGLAVGAPEHTGGGVLAPGAAQDAGNLVVLVGLGFARAGGLTC